MNIVQKAKVGSAVLFISLTGCVSYSPPPSSSSTAPTTEPPQQVRTYDTVPDPDFKISLKEDVQGEVMVSKIPNLKYERLKDTAPKQVLVGITYGYKKGDGSVAYREEFYAQPISVGEASGTIESFPWNQLFQLQLGMLGGLRGPGTVRLAIWEAVPKNDPKQNCEAGKQLSNVIQIPARL